MFGPYTFAIDPGIRSPGVAAFEGDRLIAAARIKVATKTHALELGDRVCIVAQQIAQWWRALQPARWRFDLVFEWPQIYGVANSKGDPNSLLKTLAVGAAAAALVGAQRVITPTPHDWAKNTKKATKGDPWDSQRARMVLRRLRPGERELIPDSHDAIDAVALGFWHVNRFEPICVYPGASPG